MSCFLFGLCFEICMLYAFHESDFMDLEMSVLNYDQTSNSGDTKFCLVLLTKVFCCCMEFIWGLKW
ncbi:hypothetical protein ACP275_11G003400 [Erythranthe tilingii]